MSGTVENLFGQLPDALFGPLASPNKRLYWHVLVRLYRALFEEEIEVTVKWTPSAGPPDRGFKL